METTAVADLESVRRVVRARLGAVRIPPSTYRLQLGPGFGFREAEAVVGYLEELGVGAVYFSPYFKATPGSPNGYAVTDPNALNPELGSERDFRSLCARLSRAGIAHIADIVPNHMGISGEHNPFWTDVLARGRASRYAHFFDIEWRPVKRELKDKVLLPVLGDHYGRVLDSGGLKLVFDDGRFHVDYAGVRFPVSRASYGMILEGWPEAAECVSEEARQFVEKRLAAFNGRPGESALFDRLGELLDRQSYRLAYWRVAYDEINYRRFFTINDLAAIRVEDGRVFDHCHRLLLRLIARGDVQGLRVDHPDGLYDPPAYFARLQDRCLRLELSKLGLGGPALDAVLAEEEFKTAAPLFMVVEKILDRKESLPEDWRVHGTVGYDFLNALNGLFVDRSQEAAVSAVYEEFIGEKKDFARLKQEAKALFTRVAMAGEIASLGHRLDSISELNRHYRDFTRRSLTDALRAVIECFPVYRTYISPLDREASERDERYIRIAVAKARKAGSGIRPEVFDFIEDVLLLRLERELPEEQRPLYRDFVLRFQQLTAPIMAKGIEDTAFYVDHRLLSLNEVGGDPVHFGCAPADFHKLNIERGRRWPGGLLAGSTHDTKRGEDVRLRIDALSELAEEWRAEVFRWAMANEKHKTLLGERLEPDRDTEYFIYQTLVGVWPDEPGEAWDPAFARRLWSVVEKSIREAKTRTDWADPDAQYEGAVKRFLHGLLDSPSDSAFMKAFLPFQRRVAALGALNGVSALALRLGSPGVADLYQGSELWDYSLVDPDNRRPVDFELRARRLRELKARLASGRPREDVARELRGDPRDGLIKLFVLREGLALRNRRPGLFIGGEYVPLETAGPRSEQVVAFLRRQGSRALVVAGARFFSRLAAQRPWEGTFVLLPANFKPRPLRDAFTRLAPSMVDHEGRAALRAADLFGALPAAMLVDENED